MTLKKKRPAPASFQGNAKCKVDAAIEKLQPLQITKSAPEQQYKDRFGHLHTAAVFQHWHPQIITFFDLTLVGGSS
jgi:hypothetical protein